MSRKMIIMLMLCLAVTFFTTTAYAVDCYIPWWETTDGDAGSGGCYVMCEGDGWFVLVSY
jgi:hypothetical protein